MEDEGEEEDAATRRKKKKRYVSLRKIYKGMNLYKIKSHIFYK